MHFKPRPLKWPPIFPLNKGLVAWYTFNERSGSVLKDRSGKGNHGAITGGTWAPKALSFDGSTTYVKVPAHSSLDFGLAARSFAFLFKVSIPPTATKKLFWIWETGIAQGAGVMLQTDGKLRYYPDGTGNVYSAILTALTDTWVHAVLVYDGTTGQWYVNGDASGSAVVTTGRDFVLPGVIIGSGYRNDTGATDSHVLGLIRSVRLYNRVLSAAEIKRLSESEIMLARH